MPFFLFALVLIALNSAAQPFSEVSDAVGLDYRYPGIQNHQIGGGVTVFDFDNDGWDDLFQAGGLFPSKLWRNEKGRFVDMTAAHGLGVLDGMYVNGAVAGDVDNNGWEDLFVYNYGMGLGHGDRKVPVLLINQKGKLAPLMPQVFHDPGFYTSATMADVDGNGYLDIYLTNYVQGMSMLEDSLLHPIGYDPQGLPDRLYMNYGNGTFTDRAALMGVNDVGCGLASAFTDVDNDGDPDLMVANDFGEWTKLGNRLYVNSAMLHTLSDESNLRGADQQMYGMGIGVGDVDNDLDLDLFITNIGRNVLLRNGQGRFTDATDTIGLGDPVVKDGLPGTAWSPLFFDMDHDGDLDLYLAKGNVENYIPKAVIKDPNQLFENRKGHFVEVSAGSGVDCPLSHRGAALIDFDRDGDLDIISSPIKINYGAFGNLDQKIKLYRNDAPKRGHWVQVRLVDDVQHRSTIGLHCTVHGKNGPQLREVDGGSGHASQSSKTLHFGLMDAVGAIKVKVNWGDGVEYILNEADRSYTLYRSGKVERD
jgi:hypothetical protein